MLVALLRVAISAPRLHAPLMSATEPRSAASMRRCAAGRDPVALQAALDLTGWDAAAVDAQCDGSGKNSLHHAAWRGHPDNVDMLLSLGADVNAVSTGPSCAGKSPIFYALTRCRDDVVGLLLRAGANVCIVNNKGQSPRSLAFSHCSDATLDAIVQAEEAHAHAGGSWENYRLTHSDGVEYGDQDPRFLDRPLRPDDEVTPHSINPTTTEHRMSRSEERKAEKEQQQHAAKAERDRALQSAASAAATTAVADAAAAAEAAPADAIGDSTVPPPSADSLDALHEELRLALGARDMEQVVRATDTLVVLLAGEQRKWLPETASLIRSWAPDEAALLAAAAYATEPPAGSESSVAAHDEGATAMVDGGVSLPPPRIVKLRARLLKLAAAAPEEPLARLARSLPHAPSPLMLQRCLVPERTVDGPLPLLQLGAPPVWVSDVRGLRSLRCELEGAQFVGIDTEWVDGDDDEPDTGVTVGRHVATESIRRGGVQQRLATIQLAIGGRLRGCLDGESECAVEAQTFVIEALEPKRAQRDEREPGGGGVRAPDADASDEDAAVQPAPQPVPVPQPAAVVQSWYDAGLRLTPAEAAAAAAPEAWPSIGGKGGYHRMNGECPMAKAAAGATAREYERALMELLGWLLADVPNGVPGPAGSRQGGAALEDAGAATRSVGAANAAPPQLVGFAFAGDAEILADRVRRSPRASGSSAGIAPVDGIAVRRRVLDVQPFAVSMGLGTNAQVPWTNAQVPSLRACCEAFLEFTVAKDEQCSDWGARPLREAQLCYGAVDALACILLRDKLFELADAADASAGGSNSG